MNLAAAVRTIPSVRMKANRQRVVWAVIDEVQKTAIAGTSSYNRRLGVSKLRTSSSFLARVAAT